MAATNGRDGLAIWATLTYPFPIRDALKLKLIAHTRAKGALIRQPIAAVPLSFDSTGHAFMMHGTLVPGGLMPTNQSANLAAETEALREVYTAINRNDIPGVLKFFDPQIERIEPAGFPSAGTYRGHAEVKAHLSQGRETWAEGSCEPERFIVAGDKIVVFLHVRMRPKNALDWIEGRFADVFTFRDGKAIQMRTFAERQQALEWTGVRASNAD